MKKTDAFTWNIRQETIPGITAEQYADLQAGKDVTCSKETEKYMIESGYATKEKKKGKVK